MFGWGGITRRARERISRAGQRGNRYTRQRRLGFVWLMFAPELEREYQESFFLPTRLRIRTVSALAAAGVVMYLALDQWVGDARMSESAAWLLACAGIPIISVAFVASFRARFSPQLRLAVLGSFIGYGAVLTVSILWSRVTRPEMPYESLLVLTFADYLLSGLGVYQALAAGLTLFAFFVTGSALFGVGGADLPYEIFYLLLTNCIGLIGLYALDYQSRQSFLASNELRLLSMQDGLTGLLNRRAFRRHLRQIRLQAQREGRALGLLRIDVDNFKQINDERGHAHGDQVLRLLAQTLMALKCRPLDAAGRVGGDEFEAVWYDIDAPGFAALSGRLREQLCTELTRAGLPPDSVRLSGGTVLIDAAQADALADILRGVDRALHEAKRGGRDLILPAGPF